jgi:hypothetical protein
MKILDAVEIISDAIKEEIFKRTCGSIDFVVTYTQGAVNDVQVMPKRKYNKSKNEE